MRVKPVVVVKKESATKVFNPVDDAWITQIEERPSIILEDEVLLGKLCREFTFLNQDFLPSVYYFFEVHNKQLQLLDWAIKEEVYNTAGVHDLFRGDSIATHLFYVIFFGDLGKRYLRATIVPLVKLVLASKAGALETDPAKVGKEVDTEANARLQIEFSMKFLEFLNKSSDMCPLILREALALVRKHIAVKFPEAKHVLGVIIFLRFFCPTVVFPLKHGLVTEAELGRSLTEDVERGLVLLSKTMQSLANGVELEPSKPYAELFNKFIKDYNPKIREFAEDLINEKFIKMSRRIIEASVKPPDALQISESEDELKAEIARVRPPTDSGQNSESASQVDISSSAGNILETKVKILDDVTAFTEWKQISHSKSSGITISKGKEDSEFQQFWKITFPVEASLGAIKRITPGGLEEWDSKMFFVERLEEFDPDFGDWHTLYHPPIFAAPKDYVTSVFRYSEGTDRWYQITYSTYRPDQTASKKIVRGEMAFKALVVEKNPNQGKTPTVTVTQYTEEETTATSLAKDAKTFKKFLKSTSGKMNMKNSTG